MTSVFRMGGWGWARRMPPGPAHGTAGVQPDSSMPGRVPARELAAGVVDLAEIDAVAQEGAPADLPARVRRDALRRAVLALDLEPGDQARTPDGKVLAEVPVPPHPERQRVVPALAERDADAVAAGPEEGCHVVDAVEDPLRVVCPARVQDQVAHAAAVDRRLVIAEAGDVEPGPPDPRRRGEFAAEQGRGIVFVEVLVLFGIRFSVSDPAGAPVLGRSRAISQTAGALQADGRPSLSQALTFQ